MSPLLLAVLLAALAASSRRPVAAAAALTAAAAALGLALASLDLVRTGAQLVVAAPGPLGPLSLALEPGRCLVLVGVTASAALGQIGHALPRPGDASGGRAEALEVLAALLLLTGQDPVSQLLGLALAGAALRRGGDVWDFGTLCLALLGLVGAVPGWLGSTALALAASRRPTALAAALLAWALPELPPLPAGAVVGLGVVGLGAVGLAGGWPTWVAGVALGAAGGGPDGSLVLAALALAPRAGVAWPWLAAGLPGTVLAGAWAALPALPWPPAVLLALLALRPVTSPSTPRALRWLVLAALAAGFPVTALLLQYAR